MEDLREVLLAGFPIFDIRVWGVNAIQSTGFGRP